MTSLESLSLLVGMNHLVREAYAKGLAALTEEERSAVLTYAGFDVKYYERLHGTANHPC